MKPSPRVGLFVTCLVDLFRPDVGFAAIRLLEEAGCRVEVPQGQTCCGQPAWNAGDRQDAAMIARRVIAAFEDFDHVVLPSGSCAAMMARHYEHVLAGDGQWRERARAFSRKACELTAFLVDVMGVAKVAADVAATVTYHDSCAGLRELGISEQPRKLLRSMPGIRLAEMPDCRICCGFGGMFAVKYGDISNAIVTEKAAAIERAGAQIVAAGDLGCLMNIAGKLHRTGAATQVRHVAEVLAGMTDTAPVGGRGGE